MKRILSAFVFVCISQVAYAQLFQINKDPASTVPDSAIQKLEDAVNEKLPPIEGSKYMEASANAATLAGAGNGVDYVSEMTLFAFGAGVGIGAQGDLSMSELGDEDAVEKLEGFGAGFALMLGLNLGLFGGTLGPIDMDRVNLYLSLMSVDRDLNDEVEVENKAFSIYAQYKFFKGLPLPSKFLFSWTGLDVGVGISTSTLKFVTTQEIDEDATEGAISMNFDGDATLGAEVKSTKITAEVSSGVNILYALGLYAGLGMDINSSKAEAKAGLVGDITSSAGVVGEGVLNIKESGKADAMFLRSFFGTQFNIWLLKLYVQANMSLTPADVYGVNIGTRFVW